MRACRWLEIEPKTEDFHGDESEIQSYVISLNLHRRHLTESQRAMVAEKIANTKKGRPQKKGANLPIKTTNAQAAALLNVSERSVKKAKQVLTEAEPEVTEAVESGDMTLNEATMELRKQPTLWSA